MLNLAGNDYLGLNRHPEVTAAAIGALSRWGTGSTGSRLVTGTTTVHSELEEELADFCGVEAALVFSTGYHANLSVLTALTRPGDTVFSDAVNHASLIDGCRLSRAEVEVYPHRDVAALRARLSEVDSTLLVTDSVFSVDGDRAPLAELADACAGRPMIIDEAHGLGVVGPGGRGAVAEEGLTGASNVVITVTLSKSLAGQGGAVLGPRRVIDHLVDTARPFIFDTGLAPACAAGALAALRVLRREPDRPTACRRAARLLADLLGESGLTRTDPAAGVVSVFARSPEQAVAWAANCATEGVRVGCFRPPSVPDGRSRLRLTARADLTDPEIHHAVTTILATQPAV